MPYYGIVWQGSCAFGGDTHDESPCPLLAVCVELIFFGECKLHVSTFATTRVALLTGGGLIKLRCKNLVVKWDAMHSAR